MKPTLGYSFSLFVFAFILGLYFSDCQAKAAEPKRPAASACVERNLAHFYSNGKEVQPTIVGKEKCDDFGGAYVHTPKHGIYFYVNFNIPAQVKLDTIDQALDKRTPPRQGPDEHPLRLNSVSGNHS